MCLGLVMAGVGSQVASVVLMMVLRCEVSYGPVFFAHLNLAPRAEVPRLVEGHIVPFGHGTQNPAGEGGVLPLGTHIQRIWSGDLEGCSQTCSERGEALSPA